MAKRNPDVEAMYSGGKFLSDFFAKLSAAVEKRGGGSKEVHRLVKKEGEETLGKIADLIVGDKEVAHKFKVWRTIKLGTGLKTADDFRKALKKSGNRISDWANDILGQPGFKASVAQAPTEVDLCIATTAELTGKSEGGTTAEVLAGIKRVGDLCPAEVGPQLRQQYPDQPKDEWLLIGMEPITASGGVPEVFGVEPGGGELWLCGSDGDPDFFWSGDYRWVFVRRK